MYRFQVGDRVLHGEGHVGTVSEVLTNDFKVTWDGDPIVSTEEFGDPEIWLREDPVNTPTHYQHPSGIEVIDITRYESFLRGNVIKYVLRAPYKGNELEDLKKAAKYLSWEIERVENAVPDAE